MSHQFKVDVFEGPLDLLLYLIKEQKMDIYDIPIATITRQYLDYLELIQDLNLELAAEYLIMAAELTRIKSRMLLPATETGEEDAAEAAGADPRDELARRLLEYQRFKEAAFELRKREYDHNQMFSRHGVIPIEDEVSEALVDANVFDLLAAFQKIIKQKDFKKDYEIKITTLSVEDRIKYILEILNASESATFDSLFTAVNSKQEVVVLFLALLEVMRMGLVRIQQVREFDAIRLYKTADREKQEEVLQNYMQTLTVPVADGTIPPLTP